MNTAETLKFRVEDAIQHANVEIVDHIAEYYGEPLHYNRNNIANKMNQQYFAALYHKESGVIYCPDENGFFLYDSETGLWKRKEEYFIQKEIGMTFQNFIMKKNEPDLLKIRTAKQMKEITLFLKGTAEKTDVFNSNGRNFIHCGNGVLQYSEDSGEWKLMPFSREFYSRNRTEIIYDPAAGCPRFLESLVSPAMCSEDIDLLQLYLGQCLLGNNLSQTFLMLTGTAGGGKSTLVNVIEGIVGRHNCTELRLEHIQERFETQRLIGKTLLSAKDVKSNFLNSTGAGKLKALTGNDTLSVEFKGSNTSKDIAGCFNAIVTSNCNLHVSLDGDVEAWRRRMLWIKYENPPPEEKISEFDKLLIQSEGSGVLNWMIEGARKLLQNGGKIQRTESQTKRVDDLLCESDSVRRFVSDCVRKDNLSTVTMGEMLEAYQKFCELKNWQTLPEKRFKSQIPDIMLDRFHTAARNDIKRDGKQQRGYAGYAIHVS